MRKKRNYFFRQDQDGAVALSQQNGYLFRFGNIIDNAIEAVMALPPEKRYIFLSVKEVGSLLVIHEDNPFDGTIVEEDGVIRTKKQDKFVHGYGLLSIERTVKKYGGTMKVSLQDKEFNLNIMIPIHTN